MFKFDKNTIPYHISNFVFYVFTIIVIALIFMYGFLPPILEADSFFSSIGVREFGGLLFFIITAATPLLVVYGAGYHLYKIVTFNKNKEVAE